MKSGDKARLSTLRLITAAIKDRELGIGGGAPDGGHGRGHRHHPAENGKAAPRSIATYEKAGRTDLADHEKAEIVVLDAYLPKQMDEAEARRPSLRWSPRLGAAGPKDMGKVMGALKQRYAGTMDFGKASAVLKDLLK